MHKELTRATNDTINKTKNNPYMVNPCNRFPTFKGQRYKGLNKTTALLLVCPQYVRFITLLWQVGSTTTYS